MLSWLLGHMADANAFLLGMVMLEIYCACIHPLLGLQQALPFLPLMLISSFCACALSASFLVLHWPFAVQPSTMHAKHS